MPECMTVKTDSLWGCLHRQAQVGVSRCNLCGIGSGMVLVKCRTDISWGVNEDGGYGKWG